MNIPIISLFCGCGGMDLGFSRAGFTSLLAFDKDKTAVETYNENNEDNIAEVADLSEISGEDIENRLRAKKISNYPIGVIGGAPCQTFSNGNVYVKDDDKRHTLPGEYARILKFLNRENKIDFFVFENVKGITFQKHQKAFAQFKIMFEEAGFVVFEDLLNAMYFDVPQSRPRVFVVGFNKSKYNDRIFQFPIPCGNDLMTVGKVIRDLPEPVFFQKGLNPEDIPYHVNHWTMNPKSRKFHEGFLKEGQKKGRSFRVLSWSKPSWTVAYGHREVHVHPYGRRRLSVYEAMLLQGFPKEYKMLGTMSAQYRQVCDAVPPPLAAALARSIRTFLID